MARSSTMLDLGIQLPSFTLPDTVSGQMVASASLLGTPSVVVFICNHCPFVKHIQAGLADFGRFCRDNKVAMVAISSNDTVTHPLDGPDQMQAEARTAGYGFPYLFDESQAVARAFRAACTPDLFIFDAHGRLAYRGQFDDSRPGNDQPVTGRDARLAVEALLDGRLPPADQRPSVGCGIKWKAGSAPVV